MTDELNPSTGTPAATAPRFVSEVPRSKSVPLTWPVEYVGKTYEAITVRRLTGNEVAAFFESVEGGDFPMFDCPKAVIDALDADDSEAVNKAVLDFLPRALRAATE